MLTIRLLGSPTLELDGKPFPRLRSRKMLALLLYLVHTGRPYTRESLADLLWTTTPTRQSLSNLRTALTYLRRPLGEYLHIDPGTIAFNQATRFWLDTIEFQTHLATISPDASLSPLAAAHLEQGLALYQGDFLADFHLRGAPGFDEWLILERERLHRLAVIGSQRLAAFYLERGDYEPGIRVAQRWLALDNLDEAAHACLMRLYAFNGQRTFALAQYETCRVLLQDELGVDPDVATTALYAQIQVGELTAVTTPLTAPPLIVSDETAVPHNLPIPAPPLVGREMELSQLDVWLGDPARRIITLTGAGGMGKTCLALAAARHQLMAVVHPQRSEPRFAHGVFFINLAALTDAAQIPQVIAETLGLTLDDTLPSGDQVRRHLRQQRLLLLLDNFEQLLPPPEQSESGQSFAMQLVATAPYLKLLVTSREPLDAPGETVFPIAGLPAPVDEPLGTAVQYPSIQLFLQSARRVQPNYGLTQTSLPHVARICRLLAGMPLAIELAAAWSDALAPADIVAEISSNLDFLQAMDSGVPDRQRTMRHLFASAWQRLSPAEQVVLPQLTQFRGGFTYAAAVAATATTRTTLARLVKKSLLQYDAQRQRYEMHELLRQFCAEKLPDDQTIAVRDRLSAYYCGWLAEQSPRFTGVEQKLALLAVEADLDNVRRAWTWAADGRLADRLGQAMGALHHFFYTWKGYQLAAAEECAYAAVRLVGVTAPAARLTLAWLRGWQAYYALFFGHAAQAASLRREVAAMLDALADVVDVRTARAFWLREMGKGARKSDLAQSRQWYEQSIALYRELGDTWNRVMSLSWMGDVVGRTGDADGRLRIYEETLALQERMGDRRGASFSLTYLGSLALRDGRFTSAQTYLQRALTYSRNLQETISAALTLSELAKVHLLLGRFQEAEQSCAESLSMARQAGHYIMVKDNLLLSGQIALADQRFGDAAAIFQRTELLSRESGYQPTVVDALGYTALTHLSGGRLAAALEAATAAQALAAEIGYREARWRVTLGLAHLHRGEWDAATQQAAEVGDTATRAPLALALLAAAPDAAGDWEEVERWLTAVQSAPYRYIQYSYAEAQALAGIVAGRWGRAADAWPLLYAAGQAALVGRAWMPLLAVLTGLAQLLAVTGRGEEAVEVQAALVAYPLAAVSHWFRVLAEPVTAMAAPLPAEMVAAAQARGRAAGLWEVARARLP